MYKHGFVRAPVYQQGKAPAETAQGQRALRSAVRERQLCLLFVPSKALTDTTGGRITVDYKGDVAVLHFGKFHKPAKPGRSGIHPEQVHACDQEEESIRTQEREVELFLRVRRTWGRGFYTIPVPPRPQAR